MRYRVYTGPRGSQDVPPIEKDRWAYKECSELDEALGFAQQLQARGNVALLIEGDDGTILSKREIASALGARERHQRR